MDGRRLARQRHRTLELYAVGTQLTFRRTSRSRSNVLSSAIKEVNEDIYLKVQKMRESLRALSFLSDLSLSLSLFVSSISLSLSLSLSLSIHHPIRSPICTFIGLAHILQLVHALAGFKQDFFGFHHFLSSSDCVL